MAVTFQNTTGNGSNKVFNFVFTYLKDAYVTVSIDQVQIATTEYAVSTSPTKITFNNNSVNSTVQESDGAPKNGLVVRVYRDTEVDTPKAVFAAGSSIRAADLNNNQDQVLFASQEQQNQSIQSWQLVDGVVTTDKIKDSAVLTSHLANNAVDATKLKDDTVTVAHLNNTPLEDLGANLTSTAAELNQLDGISVSSGTLGNSATAIPTSSAVNAFVLNQLEAIGGFVPIANEQSFPNSNPDPNNDAGTAVSITDAQGLVVDANGASTSGRTLGGATVTITGFPTTARSKTFEAGLGVIVQTTSTAHTYTYHRLISREEDIMEISGAVIDFANRYRVGANDPTTSLDEADLFFNTTDNILKVFDTSTSPAAWRRVAPSASDMTAINAIAGDFKLIDDLGSVTEATSSLTPGDINTVADSIDDINRYAEEYKIASSAPSSPSVGDLWYDTTNNQLKVRTSSAWDPVAGDGAGALSATDILDEDDMASNSATKVPSQQSVKAYVDGLAWLDHSAKTDGSVIYYNNSASKFKADANQTLAKIVDGGSF